MSAVCIFLNYQTYHHLFPAMSHFQLYMKRTVIDQVLAIHGIEVRLHTVSDTIRAYWSYLAKLAFHC
jgi:fatty acid desaturase